MLAQEPSIAELVVTLDQLDAIAFGQAQFIGTSGMEVIWNHLGGQQQH
jgi:hypothetical protein